MGGGRMEIHGTLLPSELQLTIAIYGNLSTRLRSTPISRFRSSAHTSRIWVSAAV